MPTRNPSTLTASPPEEPNERAPLLGGHDSGYDDHPKATSFPHRRLLLLVCLSVVAADFGNYLGYAPHIEILESIICRQARGSDLFGVDDNCKSPQVQGELALINGWKDTFDQLPGIFLALPYGFAADRIGRKPILALSLTGLILEEIATRLIFFFNAVLPLRLIWMAPAFQIIGGGPQIATAMAYAIVTDMVPSHQRASVFFVLSAATLLGEIIGTPVAAFLMSWSPWIPSLLGLFFMSLGLLGTAFISDIPFKSSRGNNQQDLEEEEGEGEGQNSTLVHDPRWKSAILRQWNHLRNNYMASWSVNLFYTVGAFLLASIGRQALQLIVQYASTRFSWSIARASSLITLKGIINLVTLLIILPWLSNWLNEHLLLSPAAKDLRIVQGSVWILTLGSAIMAISTHPAVFIVGVSFLALGWGFYSALRSLAMEMVSPSQVGIVNTAIGFAQSIGSMVSGPILAAAFRQGLQEDGIWVGLPYMVAAGLFFLSGCLTGCLQIAPGRSGA
ncbi:Major facilitator superfamily domain, general substrate transporter [Penicillium expansum]|uniref:Major facilitator superfamily domain, general substrate transporter n=1 Tax=Penicillium expansum TaxID=27334 RepID=A0A0A2L140_PENEN|nr:Major facilitator superfamily domain, general substrate transporter [Penicillium expansum]KGO39498.1 Major facilitator superfamily domain, general substrate transporter [Penicillium expansum]KGO56875.1 Major facilitator superfamily domain, general substrate transporter [Penicillium expansum]KGO70320.1 Major facilitator superfamily domain, general substrate transporter [Penicillium expansum]